MSNFTPLSLSPSLWLRADTGTFQSDGGAAAAADGDPVGQWRDQSGNSNHASEGTTKPSLKLAIVNGRPVVRFDGSNDFLGGLTVALAKSHTVTFAVKFSALSGIVLGGGSGPTSYASFFDATDWYYNAQDTFVSVAHSALVDTWYIMTVRRAATEVKFYKNGAQTETTQTLGASNDLTVTHVGQRGDSNVYLAGDLAEVVCCASALSDANRVLLEGWMNSRYVVY